MNPNSSVGHGRADAPTQSRPAAPINAIERAAVWELFDMDSLPPLPTWIPMAIAGSLLAAGILSLIGTLRGGF